jgi:hypothetical protein
MMNPNDQWFYELQEEMREGVILSDWNPRVELVETRPPKHELVCIGEYNGVDISGVEVDSNYLVWQQLPTPEHDCEVAI